MKKHGFGVDLDDVSAKKEPLMHIRQYDNMCQHSRTKLA